MHQKEKSIYIGSQQNFKNALAVAGNIGAGKTSLAELLSKHYNWDPHFEDVIDNPYLDDFYTHGTLVF